MKQAVFQRLGRQRLRIVPRQPGGSIERFCLTHCLRGLRQDRIGGALRSAVSRRRARVRLPASTVSEGSLRVNAFGSCLAGKTFGCLTAQSAVKQKLERRCEVSGVRGRCDRTPTVCGCHADHGALKVLSCHPQLLRGCHEPPAIGYADGGEGRTERSRDFSFARGSIGRRVAGVALGPAGPRRRPGRCPGATPRPPVEGRTPGGPATTGSRPGGGRRTRRHLPAGRRRRPRGRDEQARRVSGREPFHHLGLQVRTPRHLREAAPACMGPTGDPHARRRSDLGPLGSRCRGG